MIHSHLSAILFFSLVTSVVFAITSKETDRERLLYGAWVFAMFVVVTFALAWLMALGHR